MHVRIAGAGLQSLLFACALAAGVQAAESQRWQVVSANQGKVGHSLVTRTANDSNGENQEPFSYRSWDPVKLEVVEVELVRSSSGAGNVERRVRSSRGTTGSLLRADRSEDIVRWALSSSRARDN